MRQCLKFVALVLTIYPFQGQTTNQTLTMLLRLQHEIDSNHSIHFQAAGDQMEPAGQIFLSPFWKQWTKQEPILVLCLRFHVERLGNFLGNYFDSIACAMETGTHFLGVKKSLVGHDQYHHKIDIKDKFYDGMPEILVNPNPVDYHLAVENVKKICSCTRYCWLGNQPWIRQLPLIRDIINKSLQLHLQMTDKDGRTIEQKGFHIDITKDITNAPQHASLPLFPNFAVHYRCSDNVFGGMGLLTFGSIIEAIPKDAKYIYVFTEYGARLNERVFEKAAPFILQALFDDIKYAFPNSTIVIKRGGNEITIWAQFAYANVTYCSPSTFCLWPAVARTGLTYMSATNYIGSIGGSDDDHVDIHPNFKWVKKPRLYNNFTKETSPQHIISVLRTDVVGPRPTTTISSSS